ncbi:MAG: prepilin peptidase, partial [Proteobacteria bacterium]|nr:prepilin peptidase [Pseudomonadota bacterium]
EHRVIPDVISLPGILIGFACSFFFLPIDFIDSIIGIGLGGGVLLGLAAGYYIITKREGMGGGDIKLLAMIGAFIGWKGVIVTLFISSFSGSIIGLLFMATLGRSRRTALPFGPFLAIGAVIYLFYGEQLIELYMNYATAPLG